MRCLQRESVTSTKWDKGGGKKKSMVWSVFQRRRPLKMGVQKKKNLASAYKSTSSIFSVRKSLLKPSLWSLWPALLFLKTDLLCAKILCFSIETCLLRGDIDVSFLAGVMIWWIRISKPRTILAFMLVFFSVCFFVEFFFFFPPFPCLQVQILISQMNTNIYSADVWAGGTSDAFQLLKSLLEQQVATPRRSNAQTRQPFSPL